MCVLKIDPQFLSLGKAVIVGGALTEIYKNGLRSDGLEKERNTHITTTGAGRGCHWCPRVS